MKPRTFQKKILNWFDQHGRKTLPWQVNKTPYRVWVSEIMLQQTQVATVIPYYLRFMERYPDVRALAHATEDDVLHLWTGLGYYSRARHLKKTANIILETFSGNFPDSLSELESLPGIGRSTAGAILAIAFEKKAAILDGNVKRVLTRFYGISEWPGEKEVVNKLWQLAEMLTPEQRIADYTQAMMDLGATLCVRSKPHCSVCPLQKACVAHLDGTEKNLPQGKPKKIIPVREVSLIILKNKDNVLLEKRPAMGVWGSLWSFPEMSGRPSFDEMKKFCFHRFRHSVESVQRGESFRHTFSHFHLDILPVIMVVKKANHKIMEETQQIWYNLSTPVNLGLPAPIKLLLSKLS